MVDPSKPIEEVFKYADIYFEEQTFNFSVELNSTTRRVPVKWCTQDDFGYEPKDVLNF